MEQISWKFTFCGLEHALSLSCHHHNENPGLGFNYIAVTFLHRAASKCRMKVGLMSKVFSISTLLFSSLAAWSQPAEQPVVFRSDVALVRVDAQVLDSTNHAITSLRAQDFEIRDEGRVREVKNFVKENMPIDVLFLLDVSGSMRPHVEKIASASRAAMHVLREDDRVGIMVFDRQSRLRMPMRKGLDAVESEFRILLRQEKFNGGTDITRALFDAAEYMERSGRKEARKTVIIVTDDQTEGAFQVDEFGVGRAFGQSDTVLNALLAPDAMQNRGMIPQRGGYPQGGQRRGGGGRSRGGIGFPIPGGGGGYPGGGGGYPGGGGGYPGGGGVGGPRTKSAHTAEIAQDSGGDSFPVSDAFALENTLTRMRQRYTLYFLSPDDARPGQERSISVDLAAVIRDRYPNADIRYRRTYFASSSATGKAEPNYSSIDDRPAGKSSGRSTKDDSSDPDRPVMRRRPVADGTGSGPRGPNPALGGTTPTGSITTPDSQTKTGGWRKVEDPPPPVKPKEN